MKNLCRDFLLVSAGTSEYTLIKEDVGQRLAFVYIPINLEGLVFGLDMIISVFFLLFVTSFYNTFGVSFRSGREIFVCHISCCETRYVDDNQCLLYLSFSFFSVTAIILYS